MTKKKPTMNQTGKVQTKVSNQAKIISRLIEMTATMRFMMYVIVRGV